MGYAHVYEMHDTSTVHLPSRVHHICTVEDRFRVRAIVPTYKHNAVVSTDIDAPNEAQPDLR